jgi:16S rRNA (cytidine1402-2'-O)-methyltransferase
MSGGLYLVATPIGNLGDLPARAASVQADVDFIAAEDTRVTLKLLNHMNIKSRSSATTKQQDQSGEKIVARILDGESCALVTDAGMPAVSDPGEALVRACAGAGIEVRAVPGACAAVTALALSGLPSGRFTFEGFLSTARKNRFEHLNELKMEKRTMIFYEAPHKLRATLRDLLETVGNRRVSISREMTKLYEQTMRTTLSAANAHFEDTPPRGEFVLVVEGLPPTDEPETSLDEALSRVTGLREAGLSLKDAVKQCAAETGFAKNILYAAVLKNEAAPPQ